MKVNIDHIREVFTKKISKSGIVAYYIYKKIGTVSKYEVDNQKLRINNNLTNNTESNNKSTYIKEYFDLKKFSMV